MTMLSSCNRDRDIRDNSTMRVRIRRTWVAFILNRLLIIEGWPIKKMYMPYIDDENLLFLETN
jgi:hypothetical protein